MSWGDMCTGKGAFQICHLKKHQDSPVHKVNCLKYLQVKDVSDPFEEKAAPPKEDFLKVWNHVCNGSSPNAGVENVGQRQKVSKMIWSSLRITILNSFCLLY